MGIFDKIKDLVGGNADKVKDGLDKAGDMIDEKTGGEHTDKIDMATDKIGEMLEDGDTPTE
jgi:hypothetical protein